jgi:hypothetical protein
MSSGVQAKAARNPRSSLHCSTPQDNDAQSRNDIYAAQRLESSKVECKRVPVIPSPISIINASDMIFTCLISTVPHPHDEACSPSAIVMHLEDLPSIPDKYFYRSSQCRTASAAFSSVSSPSSNVEPAPTCDGVESSMSALDGTGPMSTRSNSDGLSRSHQRSFQTLNQHRCLYIVNHLIRDD